MAKKCYCVCVFFVNYLLNHFERQKSIYQKLSDNIPFCLALKAFLESHVNKTTWFEARDYCIAIGGELLSIHSATELKTLFSSSKSEFLYKSFWIGFNAPDPGTGYVWSDGSPVSKQSPLIKIIHHLLNMNREHIIHCFQVNFQNWDENEPNNRNNMESCAEMRIYRQHWPWNDIHCEKINNWLCQIRAGKFHTMDSVD